MPYAPPHACARCGAALAPGQRCGRCRPSWADAERMSAAYKAARRTVWRRDRGRCVDCGAPAAEVDHVVPRVEGGPDTVDNLVCRCSTHHRSRTVAQQQAGRRRLK
jgi:5-methylcytosine-specific restriction endonuclease McrA